jgi:hypothetical protein
MELSMKKFLIATLLGATSLAYAETWDVTYHGLVEASGQPTWWTDVGQPLDLVVEFTGIDSNNDGSLSLNELSRLNISSPEIVQGAFTALPFVSVPTISGNATPDLGAFSFSKTSLLITNAYFGAILNPGGETMLMSAGHGRGDPAEFDFLSGSTTFHWDTSGATITAVDPPDPVPEPATFWLLLAGVGAVFIWKNRSSA